MRLLKITITLMLIIVPLILYEYEGIPSSNELEVVFADVGQGDTILIKDNEGGVGIIDGGKDTISVSKLTKKLGKSKHIDYVIATHSDWDHIGGLVYLFDYYQVDRLFIADSRADLELNLLLSKAAAQGTQINRLDATTDFVVGCCLKFDILWPTLDISNTDLSSNDLSIAFKLNYGDFDAYLGGDLGTPYEYRSVSSLETGKMELLKVGHHGSKSSSSLDFLSVISPQVAVVSAGRNNQYGHPHAVVLENLGLIEADNYGTYESGDITVKTDGTQKFAVCLEVSQTCVSYPVD